jgi:SnoaL-like protein
MSESAAEKVAIREVIENWIIWRDSGDWERFRSVWHADGRMMATWFQGTAEEFIRVSREGMDRGVSIFHSLGGSSLEVAGPRAVAQTRATISQRGLVHGVLCDVACTGRFYDFFEKRDGRWAIVLRRLIYEKDRMDPVNPSDTISLDAKLLERFPEGYRHLAYLQTNVGFTVKTDLPGLKGSEVEALYRRGEGWLAGEPL